MSDLLGKVALVTGASRGIGRAIAVELARAGADIGVNYLARVDDAQDSAREIAALGRRSVLVPADVRRGEDIHRMVGQVEQDLGPIDILVNNAGVTKPMPLEQLTEHDWHEVIATNLTSAFLATQAVLPGMRLRHWGRIINLSSVAAQLGGVVGPHYAASKAGIHGLTHSYAALLAKEGITVNTIAPALIMTEMVMHNPKAKADLIPVGRFGEPDEVADLAVLLASNGYITGQTFNVNGGWYMS